MRKVEERMGGGKNVSRQEILSVLYSWGGVVDF